MEPLIRIKGSFLWTVPAVHYRAVFANEVNRLCSSKNKRPDAIAVELSSCMVKAIVTWMKELGIGTGDKIILPSMIGLIMENRLIHPDFKASASFLQQHYKKPLRKMHPEILKHFLHFSGKQVLGLSSTDSIIEAIRCAVELDIPVYGVDMDEYSTGNDERLLIEEPGRPSFDLEQYVVQNEKTAMMVRDQYVDTRRELVMAARLKTILSMHRKVLFTGGLAHWERMKHLLTNSEIRPADLLFTERPVKISRVILHPFIALRFMDTYPILSTLYEKCRNSPLLAGENSAPLADAGELIRGILDKTYLNFSNEINHDVSEGSAKTAYRKIPDFERLLAASRLIAHTSTPSMAALMEVSESMMTNTFTQQLAVQLMDIDRSWATPAMFPGIPLISVFHADQIDQGICEQYQLTEVDPDGSIKGSVFKKRPEPFTAQLRQGNPGSNLILRYWRWKNEPKEREGINFSPSWIWPPCEALLYGTATEAAKIAIAQKKETLATKFEGSLYDGFDTKASMRSIICGENRIYVKKNSLSKDSIIPDGKSPDPTVFIFCSQANGIDSSWSVLVGGRNIGNYVKNKNRFEEVKRKYGSVFVSSIALNHSQKVPETLKSHVDEIHLLEGITMFGNPCINARQSASWVEDNDYTCCPVTSGNSVNNLIREYKRFHQLEIDAGDWQTALIQFAIPYARERVVVVAPGKFRISRKLHALAKRRKVSLDLLPLTTFPAVRIAEMRKRISVPSMDQDGCIFPKETEIVLGQSADQYMNLLPVYMQNQLKK